LGGAKRFSDLIGDINGVETPVGDGATADDLIGWLGEDFQEDDALHSQESTDLFLYDPYSETTLSSTGRPELSATAATPDELNNLFGDSLFEKATLKLHLAWLTKRTPQISFRYRCHLGSTPGR
jgi:hypothetical protein